MNLESDEYVNPNKPIKISVLTATFEKIIVHNSNKLKIVHDLLDYMDAFIIKNLPSTEVDRVERKVTLNLTGYFLLKTISDLDL